MSTQRNDGLLLPSGGFRKLKSFQLARLIYDITFRFTNFYIPIGSRTHDQMVQAARSGTQNIAEGSVDAATSAKSELRLYKVAQGSLAELQLDYEDYLRQHQEKIWDRNSPLYNECIRRRISNASEFREFIAWAENMPPVLNPDREVPYKSVLVANAVLLLLNTAIYFLQRQIEYKENKFCQNGGFSERMYKKRKQNNSENNGGNLPSQ